MADNDDFQGYDPKDPNGKVEKNKSARSGTKPSKSSGPRPYWLIDRELRARALELAKEREEGPKPAGGEDELPSG